MFFTRLINLVMIELLGEMDTLLVREEQEYLPKYYVGAP